MEGKGETRLVLRFGSFPGSSIKDPHSVQTLKKLLVSYVVAYAHPQRKRLICLLSFAINPFPTS